MSSDPTATQPQTPAGQPQAGGPAPPNGRAPGAHDPVGRVPEAYAPDASKLEAHSPEANAFDAPEAHAPDASALDAHEADAPNASALDAQEADAADANPFDAHAADADAPDPAVVPDGSPAPTTPIAPITPSPSTAGDAPPEDLGFGSVVAGESRMRLLNPDGSFNVARRGLGFWTSLSAYHALLRLSWPRFLGALGVGYIAVNVLFTLGYMACGPDAITGDAAASGGAFLHDFFFSVQTIATIGFGQAAPVGIRANTLVVLEALVGVLGFAFATGLLFARVSRPTARIVFSRRAVVAPYRGRRGFMLRIANARRSEIIELQAKVILSLFEDVGGRRARRFHALELERRHVAFFPLAWTIVHPIDEQSPLHGRTERELLAAQAEFLVLLTGIEETFSQTVHARSSYRAEEVVWGARFIDIFNRDADDGDLTIDMGRLHGLEPAPLPPA